MSHRLIGRFLQLGSTEEIYSRRAEPIAVGEESSNQKIGRPVPVVFGTMAQTHPCLLYTSPSPRD